MAMMLENLIHSYIQSTIVLCDIISHVYDANITIIIHVAHSYHSAVTIHIESLNWIFGHNAHPSINTILCDSA